MGELVFIGLGLYDEKDVSLKGLEEIKSADHVFADLYTSLLKNFSIDRLEKLTNSKIFLVSRGMLEEDNGRILLEAAENGKVVFLSPGDSLIATTHISLRLEAMKNGVQTRVIHGASIISAVMGLTGLHNYKFGRSVTIPFKDVNNLSETPYNVIQQNRAVGLHTLCFLDLRAEEKRYMEINEALKILIEIEKKKNKSTICENILIVGVARAGSPKPVVKAGWLKRMLSYNFGGPPHTLVFPGRLHFMEAEALIKLANAPENIRNLVK